MEVITNTDTMYYYFEWLKQRKPKYVLDVGMFLKRIGAISRQMMAMSSELDAGIVLCGVDFFPQYKLPVYEKIYDEIVSKDAFFQGENQFPGTGGKHFDVAVTLETETLLNDAEKEALWTYLLRVADGVMADEETGIRLVAEKKIKDWYAITVDNSSYAWIPLEELKL